MQTQPSSIKPHLPDNQPRVELLFWLLAGCSVLIGVFNGISHAWVNDDAFISFRYAKNFVEGNGLVYNSGERVEGYTNFLWTILVALGMRLNFDPVSIATSLGIAFSGSTLFVFSYLSRRFAGIRMSSVVTIPLTALALSLHRDFGIYATSGLETSMYTFLISWTYAILTLRSTYRSLLGAGMLIVLAMMTRPDGVIFLGTALFYIILTKRDWLKRSLIFLLPAIIIFLPYWMMRYAYYGDFFPNSYYAKSIALPYYGQGLWYTGLYFTSYYVFLVLLPLGILTLLHNQRELPSQQLSTQSIPIQQPLKALRDDRPHPLLLAVLFSAASIAFVIRIGGDFMFARFLIPITPILYFMIELMIGKLGRPSLSIVMSLSILVATLFRFDYYHGRQEFMKGVADEWSHYPKEYLELAKAQGLILHKYFSQIPVTVACMGGQAQLVYYADPAAAIESTTGLTDRFIAHMPLVSRGRVGHEKAAPKQYLEERTVNFMFVPDTGFMNDISFEGVRGKIIVYENRVMSVLECYPSVKFTHMPEFLDAYIKSMHNFPRFEIQNAYAHFKTYYFDHNSDSLREESFLAALRENATSIDGSKKIAQ